MSRATTRETVAVLGSYAPSLINFRGPMIERLVSRGHRVVALAPNIDAGVRQRLAELGAEAREVAISNTSINPMALLASFRSLKRALREVGPTALIPYTVQPVTIGTLAASQLGVTKIIPIITGLGYAFSDGGGARQRVSRWGAMALYRLALARSSTVIFQNRDDRDELRARRILAGDKPTAIVDGSGIDLGRFRPCPLPAAPSFIMVARLTRLKGVSDYGAATAELKRRYPSARFRLAGWFDGSKDEISREELDRMVAGGIEYLGKVDDVRLALADSNVFVLPSRYREGVPRSALEAIAMGRPVITYDMPGSRETVIDGRSGFLIPPGDVAQLARAMERFVQEPTLATTMGREARLLAARFDVDSVNQAIVEAADL